jgi:drug/metabolite transporter (DMT)-like permease
MAEPAPLNPSSVAIALLVCLLWGGNLVSLKVALTAVPPFWSAFWRMLLGAVVVMAWARIARVPIRPAPGEGRGLFGLAVLFTAQIALLNMAAEMTSPAYGEVILNSYAIFANLIAHFASRNERLTPLRVVGLALAFGGICVVALGRPQAALAPKPLAGNLVMVASAFLLGARQVYTRRLVQRVNPVRAMVWQLAWSVPMFALGAVVFAEPTHTQPLTIGPVAALAYQGIVVAGCCFVGWAWLLKQHASGTVSMFSFLVPFAGIAFSRVFLGEAPRGGFFVGVSLAVGGLLLTSLRPPGRR